MAAVLEHPEALIEELRNPRTTTTRIRAIATMPWGVMTYPEIYFLLVARIPSYARDESWHPRVIGTLSDPAVRARVLSRFEGITLETAAQGLVALIRFTPDPREVLRWLPTLEPMAMDKLHFWYLSISLLAAAERQEGSEVVGLASGLLEELVKFLLSDYFDTPEYVGWSTPVDLEMPRPLGMVIRKVLSFAMETIGPQYATRAFDLDRFISCLRDLHRIPVVVCEAVVELLPVEQLERLRMPIVDCMERMIASQPFKELKILARCAALTGCCRVHRERCIALLRSRGVYSIRDFLGYTHMMIVTLFKEARRADVEPLLVDLPSDSPLFMALGFVTKNDPLERPWVDNQLERCTDNAILEAVRGAGTEPSPGRNIRDALTRLHQRLSARPEEEEIQVR